MDQKKYITGVVEWFDTTQGVGYAKTDEGNYVKITYKSLPIKNGDFVIVKPKDKIRFEIIMDENGPVAKNIQII